MPAQLPTRKIGDVDVSAIGYGTMGLSAFYGPIPSDEERLKVSLDFSALPLTVSHHSFSAARHYL